MRGFVSKFCFTVQKGDLHQVSLSKVYIFLHPSEVVFMARSWSELVLDYGIVD